MKMMRNEMTLSQAKNAKQTLGARLLPPSGPRQGLSEAEVAAEVAAEALLKSGRRTLQRPMVMIVLVRL